MVVLAAFPTANRSQVGRQITRQEFSRLSLLSRAAYFEQAMAAAAHAEGVDPNLLWTIAYNETRFRPWLTSKKGAKGMMQFVPSTAARFDLSNPYDASASITAASRYLKYLSVSFGGRLDSILAAYNAGEGAVSSYMYGRPLRIGAKIINAGGEKTIGGVPPYTETVAYVGRGLKVYRWLERHGRVTDIALRAAFPSVISASVARVPLVDPELGSVSAFPRQDPGVPLASRNSLDVKTARSDPHPQKEMPPQKIVEVYYDPRSGNRYQYRGGSETTRTIVNLRETGQVIISNDTRTGISSRARTTFVGALVGN